ncbi:hypothetical protein T492DRAFT_833084 [Pavlovales sp. CCMP2436]|nr:hypothetical protein T492DRAFT_833084 [Pavlovales sp. CCMP2436]
MCTAPLAAPAALTFDVRLKPLHLALTELSEAAPSAHCSTGGPATLHFGLDSLEYSSKLRGPSKQPPPHHRRVQEETRSHFEIQRLRVRLSHHAADDKLGTITTSIKTTTTSTTTINNATSTVNNTANNTNSTNAYTTSTDLLSRLRTRRPATAADVSRNTPSAHSRASTLRKVYFNMIVIIICGGR